MVAPAWGRSIVFAVCLCASAAQAQRMSTQGYSLEGEPRITVQGGWRMTVNDTFAKGAALLDHPQERPSNGGPQGSAIFGYGVTSFLEVAIDLFIGYEQFKLRDFDAISALAYGALIGVRLHKVDFGFRGFTPSIGIAVGPTLGLVSSNSFDSSETLGTAYAGTVGLAYRFNERWGMQLEYRFMIARAAVTDLPSISIGGNWLSAGVTFFFPQEKETAPSLSF